MTKSRAVTLAYIVFLAIILTISFVSFNKKNTEIDYSIVVEEGSFSDIAGIQLQLSAMLNDSSVWNSNLTFSDSGLTSKTSFETGKDFYSVSKGIYGPKAPLFHFSSSGDAAVFFTWNSKQNDALRKKADTYCNENNTNIYVTPLFEVSPYYFCEFTGDWEDISKEADDSYDFDGYTASEFDIDTDEKFAFFRGLSDFIKIPVLKDETLVVIKNTDEYFYRINPPSLSTPPDDYFTLNLQAKSDGRNMFFWFSNRTHNGNLVNTSEIPGGYGLYVLPFEKGNEHRFKSDSHYKIEYHFDQMRNILPLNETDEIVDVQIDFSTNDLLVHTVENGKFFLKVLDPDTLKLNQNYELDINYDAFKKDAYNIIHYDGIEMIHCSDETHDSIIIKKGTDGNYLEVFRTCLLDWDGTLTDFFYKDNKLVLLSLGSENNCESIPDDTHFTLSDHSDCFHMIVLSEEKTIFRGEITCDLLKANYNYVFYPDDQYIESKIDSRYNRVEFNQTQRCQITWD